VHTFRACLDRNLSQATLARQQIQLQAFKIERLSELPGPGSAGQEPSKQALTPAYASV